MVQRLTYRTRHSYATKSNQHRVVKTPGNVLQNHSFSYLFLFVSEKFMWVCFIFLFSGGIFMGLHFIWEIFCGCDLYVRAKY